MKQIFILVAVLCGLLLPRAAMACAFSDASYVPDPTDVRTRSNYYFYKISVTPDLRLVLDLVHPQTKQVVTKLRMQYRVNRDADPMATVTVSPGEIMEVEFFNTSLGQVPVYSGADEAPATMILRDSYSKFLTLADNGLDIDYLTNPAVKPGTMVDSRLELVPDVWVLDSCASDTVIVH